jgi:hypothetical protein
MRLVLHALDQKFPIEAMSSLSIGSDPSSTVYLPSARQTENFAEIRSGEKVAWLLTSVNTQHTIHHNGRRIDSVAMLRAGDDLHFGEIAVQVRSKNQPVFEKSVSTQAVNFSDRILLRICSGAETGKAYALVNSLCIGRSTLSEICVDDPALAERQILVQRQGNDVLVKNLSPALEMRVDGWICHEAILSIDSQLNIEQHRFILQSSSSDLAYVAQAHVPEKPAAVPENATELTQKLSKTGLFNRSQWILLGSAVAIAVLFVLLLTISS